MSISQKKYQATKNDFHIISIEDVENVLDTIENEKLYTFCFRAMQKYKYTKDFDVLIDKLGLAKPIFVKRLFGLKIINFIPKLKEQGRCYFNVEEVLTDKREIDLFMMHKRGVFNFMLRANPNIFDGIYVRYDHLKKRYTNYVNSSNTAKMSAIM